MARPLDSRILCRRCNVSATERGLEIWTRPLSFDSAIAASSLSRWRVGRPCPTGRARGISLHARLRLRSTRWDADYMRKRSPLPGDFLILRTVASHQHLAKQFLQNLPSNSARQLGNIPAGIVFNDVGADDRRGNRVQM